MDIYSPITPTETPDLLYLLVLPLMVKLSAVAAASQIHAVVRRAELTVVLPDIAGYKIMVTGIF